MLNTNMKFRLILSHIQNAKINMATDDALVSSFEKEDLPILRIYFWEKSFTMGISQKISNYIDLIKQTNNNYAKRITGGGVLHHGHDISYSLVLPSSYMKNMSVKQSYEKICTFILEFYKNLGLKATYAKDEADIKLSKNEFCQIGFEPYDILINGKKIGGNAQKRTKKVIFQHGSIPLRKIDHENINKNLYMTSSLDQLNIDLSNEEAQENIIKAFQKVFCIQFEESSLNKKEKESLTLLLKDNYDYA